MIDAGLGMPSHAAEAIEMGADAVLVNTAVAAAKDPVKMATAFARAIEAAELALAAEPPAPVSSAVASSPADLFASPI